MRLLIVNKKRQSRKASRISRQKLRLIKGTLFLLSILIVGFILYKGYFLLLVRNYRIIGYNGTNQNSIENYLANSKPQNFFLVNENDLLNTLNKLDKNIQIERVNKIFPDTLEIRVNSQNGFLKVIISADEINKISKIILEFPIEATSSSNEKVSGVVKEFIISDTGMILNKVKNENLPLIYIQDINGLNYLQNSITLNKIKEIRKGLLNNAITEEELILIGNSLIVKQSPDIFYLFSMNKPIENQVRSLQVIGERFTIEGIKPKKIDVRFDKPVVLF